MAVQSFVIQRCCRAYKLGVTNNKDKLSSLHNPNSNHFNLLQFCPSLPPFAFAAVFKPFFNVSSSYFSVSVDLFATLQWLNLAKFRDTAPLKQTKIIASYISIPITT